MKFEKIWSMEGVRAGSAPLDPPQCWPVADSGFPRGGGANPKAGGGRQPIIWPIFPENCMKMKKFWARGGRGRVPRAPLRSATAGGS